jgi:hypothetical protein
VLLHVLLVLVTWNVQLAEGGADDGIPGQEDMIELTLVPDEDTSSAESQLPSEYTAIPERLATEEPPEQADYLALYQSIAADRVLGDEDTSAPAADEESEINKVAIRKDELDGAGGETYNQQPLPQEASKPATSPPDGSSQQERSGLETTPLGETPLAPEGRQESDRSGEADSESEQQDPVQPEWIGGSAPSILKEGRQGSRGDRGFDFEQLALGKIEGNVVVSGAYSLNTTEWDFAPWMHRFEQDLYRNWIAPYAYALGVISGETKIKLVVEMDGRSSQMEVIGSEGHESLHQASTAALQAFAPYQPLPSDFPEENLVIILTLHYPAWKHEQLPPRGNASDSRRRGH